MYDKPLPRSFILKAVATSLAIVIHLSRVASTPLAAPPTIHPFVDALPPDLPLPASPPSEEKWLREASILQPYGHSAFVSAHRFEGPPRALKKEFGFNAIIVQPPDSHNTIVPPAEKLTEKQFADGIAAYRAAGYRIMLYTSVMGLGLAPEFQSGQISREHPDWLQRDPKGNPVLVWDIPWLCPSTGAREIALDRCVRIARQYNADGIMLDNNEFYYAAAGWTCHCEGCKKACRQYVHKRFGDKKSTELFGAAPDKLQIPTAESPLYFEWLHWRNRVWADVNETFRSRLRKQNPSIIFFANTQYAFENGMLATDLQYAREDVVLSESCELNARQMSAKMVLGHAMAAGRPLWNYIGTFAKNDDYTGLRPSEAIGPAIAVTLAHNARPWIVDGFDEGPTNAESRALMSKLLSWHANHQNLFQGKPYSAVATIISTTSRNVRHTPLIAPHLLALQAAGVPVIALRDESLTEQQLRPFRVITIETAACLPADSATTLAAWARNGGTLIAAHDTGSFDELGREQPRPQLWQSLTPDTAPTAQHNVGHGRVITPEPEEFAATAVRYAQPYSFLASSGSGAEVIASRTATTLVLHIIRHEKAGEPVTLLLHKSFAPKSNARLHIPGLDRQQDLPLTVTAEGTSVTIPNAPRYCVIEIPLP